MYSSKNQAQSIEKNCFDSEALETYLVKHEGKYFQKGAT